MVGKVRQAVVMVGGKGTRLLPLTETKPKIILPVADRPCLWYLLRSLARAGIEEVILACGYKSEQMRDAIGDGSDLGISIVYSYEDEPLGTGGAMKLVEDRLDDVFVAANGDVFASIDVSAEIEEHIRSGAVLGYVPEGTFFDFSKDLVPCLMADGHRIQGFEISGIWMDVGRPHDLLGANLAIAASEHSGEHDGSDGCVVEGTVYTGDGSEVVDTTIRDSVVLAGSKVSGSDLDRVLLMRGCVVDGATLENCILGDACTVGKGAVVRNAVLGDGTVVGPGETLDGDRVV